LPEQFTWQSQRFTASLQQPDNRITTDRILPLPLHTVNGQYAVFITLAADENRQSILHHERQVLPVKLFNKRTLTLSSFPESSVNAEHRCFQIPLPIQKKFALCFFIGSHITNHRCPPGLACRLGRCFCFAEVSTGHPHPLRRRVPFGLSVGVIIPH